ncbi:MAG: hypothetical protein RBS88_04320 [Spongiibacteraceae bacterium]|jgi:hypothetical protein|nr:hypothetical protein [Spongiibacteraceae bacterium]
MARNRRAGLRFNRPDRRQGGGPLRFEQSQALREHVLREIMQLQSELERLKAAGPAIDLGLIKSYEEMIRSRRAFYQELDA